MIVLGIETSCDETSVAILKDGKLTANLIASQDFHSKFGGVVPELSSRAHLQIIIPLLKDALKKSELQLSDIDLVAATAGPGLIGALLVGLTFAKGLAYSLNKPFVAVNHIEGHIFSGFLMNKKPSFPFLVLVVSGGHTLLLLVESFTKINKLGSTVDDAAGEAFDKVSKLLGFGYPGGPQIQKAAEDGEENLISFPIAELKEPYNFSFSGLKTAVLRYIESNFKIIDAISQQEKSNIAAAFQNAVVKALIKKVEKALNEYEVNSLSLAGGVAANAKLRKSFENLAVKYHKKLVIPNLEFCGDNAAMIAFCGMKSYEFGLSDNLSFSPYPGLTPKHFSPI